jgi:hypothetical protein
VRGCLCLRKDVKRSSPNLCSAGCTTYLRYLSSTAPPLVASLPFTYTGCVCLQKLRVYPTGLHGEIDAVISDDNS